MGEVCEVVHKITRHHMLYPRKVWMRVGQCAFDFRNEFTLMMPDYLHQKLHRKIDKMLGEELSEDDLPDESTFQCVLMKYKKDEKVIRQYEPIEKLEWVVVALGLSNDSKLNKLIRLEISFLEEHKDEL